MKTIFISFLLVVTVTFSQAQMRGRNQSEHGPFEKIEELKKVKMIEALGLSEDQSVKLIARYNKHRETMKAIENDRSDLVDKLEEQINANSSNEEFDKTFAALGEIDSRMRDARRTYLESLKEVLSKKQLAQYFVFERNFARDIRNMAKDIQRKRFKN
ncbi:MAG: hypothetical protein H3C35_06195 [Bacteroidetes bacterium]|nr:hypothetical protein [Bacteroidota bacterium]